MERNDSYKCPWPCPSGQDEGFSEAQAYVDIINVKIDGKYGTMDIIQCPYCGGKVKRHRHGWIKDEGGIV